MVPDEAPLCPDFVHGAAACSYCETATNNTEGNLSDNRRRVVLGALSSANLGLTEKEQKAIASRLDRKSKNPSKIRGADCHSFILK